MVLGHSPRPPAGTKNWAAQAAVEGSHGFDGIDMTTGQLQLDLANRFGLETAWTWFRERISNDQVARLVIGEINAVFRFAQQECVQFTSGIGVRVLTDQFGTDGGFNFT